MGETIYGTITDQSGPAIIMQETFHSLLYCSLLYNFNWSLLLWLCVLRVNIYSFMYIIYIGALYILVSHVALKWIKGSSQILRILNYLLFYRPALPVIPFILPGICPCVCWHQGQRTLKERGTPVWAQTIYGYVLDRSGAATIMHESFTHSYIVVIYATLIDFN